METKKGFKIPHIFTILIIFAAIMAVLTYIIPAGEYLRVEGPGGRMMIDPTTYHVINNNPVGIMKFLTAIPQGFVDAGWVVVLTFCVGGGFVVVKKTGIIEIAVNNLATKMSKRGAIVIPVLMITFAVIDAFIGMPELCMVYVPIILPLALALGFDSITAVAIALVGSAAGFTAALTNPFTIGIAQKIAGLPLYSGAGFRIITLIVMTTVGVAYVLRYAIKVKRNPESSLVYEDDLIQRKNINFNKNGIVKATTRQNLAGISAIVLFVIMIFGVFKLKWDMPEIGGMFIAIAIVSGIVGGLTSDEICAGFLEGCEQVLVGALIIGLARAIPVIMTDGKIMDTIVFSLAKLVQGLPGSVTSVGMLFVQTFFNFLVPSGSGQALITMPIMAPLADIVGVTRQTAVLALQFGDGFSNILYPTSGYFMASLALAGVKWQKWAKFILPLFLVWSFLAAIFLIIAQAIKFGPF